MKKVTAYKVDTLANLKPNAIVALKTAGASTFSLYVTDLQGVPHSLNLPATTGVQQITNTDGALQVVGSTNVVINLEPAILASINSALQVGDNISSLLNDAGYLTSFTESDPIFLASEASNFVAGDKANLDNQSGINTNDETTSTIQTKRPLKTITNKSLEGTGNIGIDYNDLDNKPTIPSPITNHSGLSLDDGTNPHGTTKGDVGLGNVDNTSDIDKPISNATQTALNSKQNSLGFTPENVSNKENTTLDASPTKYPTNRLVKEVTDLKLDKVSTAGVERAYIINADGSQGTKATSEFKDIIEVANLSALPATGESGKIYVAIDTNLQYRWSGSAYVQIGGGIENDDYLYPIVYQYQATGGGIDTVGTFPMNIVGNQSDQFGSGSGGTALSYRRILSASTAGSSAQAREGSFLRIMPNRGFKYFHRFRIFDSGTVSDSRFLIGLGSTAGIGNTDISANSNQLIGIGADGTDSNIHLFNRNTFGTFTLTNKIDLGYGKNDFHEYIFTMVREKNSGTIVCVLKNLTLGTEVTQTVTNTQQLTIVNHRNNNSTAVSVGFEIQRIVLRLSE